MGRTHTAARQSRWRAAPHARRPGWRLALVALVASAVASGPAAAQDRLGVQRFKYESAGGQRYLALEILDDDLAHFELSEVRTGSEPGPQRPIYITPIVDAAAYPQYPGPTRDGFASQDRVVETAEMRISVEDDARCVRVFDKARNVALLHLCGEDLAQPTKRLRIDREEIQNVYGVGSLFYTPDHADGDWVGRHWDARRHGHFRFGTVGDKFHKGDPSVSQFPLIYALGRRMGDAGFHNYALLLDHVYRMSWDFRDAAQWTATTWGDQLRWFVITGADLQDLRRDVMELTGRPPVPPRAAFGLWVSEFGYDNWSEIRGDLDSLRAHGFPVDGVVLDLQWFGGSFSFPPNCQPDRMGSLTFNTQNFPSPETEIRKFRDDYGVRFMAIEESYIDNRLPEHGDLWQRGFLARVSDTEPVTVTSDISREGPDDECMWWGRGGMIDWTNPEARRHWHQLKRQPLALLGITGHWLDLGEPEMYYQDAIYHGFPELGKNRHGDVHNVYNHLWAQGIADGYRDPANQQQLQQALELHAAPRHFVLSRAGTLGSQRYTAMWSGDVAQNMGNLRAHLGVQTHMSLLGMDYYSSDAGGFLTDTAVEAEHDDAELYTQWFANNALLDVPLRPHAWAYGEGLVDLFTVPDQRGHRDSNRANLLLRYELAPYLYSLAHRAHRFGEPVFPPLIYHFQSDPNVRGMGNVKMIGSALLFGVVAGHGQTDRGVYLPAGRWADYHAREWYDSPGRETPAAPVYRDRQGQAGLFTLPLYARAGAIIPVMYVDERTRNVSGRREVDLQALSPGERQRESVLAGELRLKVFAGDAPSAFTLYEDDGVTLDYLAGQVRETRLEQLPEGDAVRVTVHPAQGSFHGAVSARANVIELVLEGREATGVELNGSALPQLASVSAFGAGEAGWYNAGTNLVRVRTPVLPVSDSKALRFQLSAPLPARSSVHFVCADARTEGDEAVYVLGNLPQLGAWDPAQAVRLSRLPYGEPTRPWTATVTNLPTHTRVEWKCVKRKQAGGAVPQWEHAGPNNVIDTPASGFAGTARGRFGS
jgi:alpha-glucosidase